MQETYFSALQTAGRYSVHIGTVWRWAGDPNNTFPKPVQLSAGCTRWLLSDLEEWEQAKTSAA